MISHVFQAVKEIKARYDDVLKTNMSLVGHHNLQQRIHRYDQVLKESEKLKLENNALRKVSLIKHEYMQYSICFYEEIRKIVPELSPNTAS